MDEMDDEGGSGGGWITTFADLMSLLLSFFVLLLSFSEMDVAKYKQLSGSMKSAFGVQNQIKVKDTPKGTSFIAREFSPGKTVPTVKKTIQQVSADTVKKSLAVCTTPTEKNKEGDSNLDQGTNLTERASLELNARISKRLQKKLATQIEKGNIEVEYDQNSVTVRIREQGSFPSGSADLTDEFYSVIPVLQETLRDTPGTISIEGHTDNVPIHTFRFRSNWELSSQRALTFARALMADPILSPKRFMVVGYADARPRASNDTRGGRAENRRVEIQIRRDPGRYGTG